MTAEGQIRAKNTNLDTQVRRLAVKLSRMDPLTSPRQYQRALNELERAKVKREAEKA